MCLVDDAALLILTFGHAKRAHFWLRFHAFPFFHATEWNRLCKKFCSSTRTKATSNHSSPKWTAISEDQKQNRHQIGHLCVIVCWCTQRSAQRVFFIKYKRQRYVVKLWLPGRISNVCSLFRWSIGKISLLSAQSGSNNKGTMQWKESDTREKHPKQNEHKIC